MVAGALDPKPGYGVFQTHYSSPKWVVWGGPPRGAPQQPKKK